MVHFTIFLYFILEKLLDSDGSMLEGEGMTDSILDILGSDEIVGASDYTRVRVYHVRHVLWV